MIKRKDLVDIGDADYKQRADEFMQCQDCGEEFGGTQGDFFMMPMNEVFVCPVCHGEDIALVKNVTQTVILKQ